MCGLHGLVSTIYISPIVFFFGNVGYLLLIGLKKDCEYFPPKICVQRQSKVVISCVIS